MRHVFITTILLASIMAPSATKHAFACPMCKTATEDAADDSQPKAYMASILTMLTMPAVLFTILGVSIYRMNRRENEFLQELDNHSGQL